MEQENLHSKGFFGILGLSIRLIHSRRRLFLSLAAAILLPLAGLSLAGRPIAQRYIDSDSYYDYSLRQRYVVAALLFSFIYGIIYLAFLLLAAAAALHAAASAYAAREAASLRRSLLRAAPRAWPRLLGTAFWGLLLTVVYLVAGAFIFGLALGLAKAASSAATALRVLAIILACVVGAGYIAGALYVSVLLHFAVAATVLEGAGSGSGSVGSSCWGIAAIKKARALVRGRVIMCCALLLLFDVVIFAVGDICWRLALYAFGVPLAGRIAAGAGILLALTGLFLLGMTVLAVAYLVLKAWHGEAVDPVSIAAKMDACAGEYERMVVPSGGAGNVQMMHHIV